MASSVYYRFKSSKDSTRIPFDGTGISVFELKKAIIETSNLGDGTDFELLLFSTDEKEGKRTPHFFFGKSCTNTILEYSDDTEIIPRSTTVIARRKPAERPGRGGAARYVSGKAPTTSKNAQRTENIGSRNDTNGILNTSAAASAISELQTEKQREEAVLKLGADMWKHQQKEMAS
jgi:protein MPE1